VYRWGKLEDLGSNDDDRDDEDKEGGNNKIINWLANPDDLKVVFGVYLFLKNRDYGRKKQV
jgi:hypothetical protein